MRSMKEAIITAIFGRAPFIYIYLHLYLISSPQTYIFTSGEWYFIPLSFSTFSHFHVQWLRRFCSLKYPGGIFNGSPTCFFLFFIFFNFLVDRWTRNGNIFDDRLILPLILPSTISITFSLFLNHHRWLIILRSERDWCVSSCSEYFQFWVRFYGDHSSDLCHKLVGWFLYGRW